MCIVLLIQLQRIKMRKVGKRGEGTSLPLPPNNMVGLLKSGKEESLRTLGFQIIV